MIGNTAESLVSSTQPPSSYATPSSLLRSFYREVALTMAPGKNCPIIQKNSNAYQNFQNLSLIEDLTVILTRKSYTKIGMGEEGLKARNNGLPSCEFMAEQRFVQRMCISQRTSSHSASMFVPKCWISETPSKQCLKKIHGGNACQ